MLATLRTRDFGLLWLAGLVSVAGDFALIVALPLHVYRLTDSTLATAGTLAAGFVPRVVGSSVAGVFVDRWDRKRTMVVADLGRAVVLLALLAGPERLGLIYAVAAVQATIGLFFGPAEGALLPRLVGEDRLVAANALNAFNDNLGMLVGPALGSLLYAGAGIEAVVLVDAATYVVAALLISLIAADGRPEATALATGAGGSPWRRVAGEWRAGLGVVRRDRALTVLFATWPLVGVAEGIFLTLGLTPLVLDVLKGTPAQVGWLGTAQAFGGLVAGLAVARFGHRLATRWLHGGGIVGVGLADLGSANARLLAGAGTPAVGVAMGWMVVAGLPAVAGGVGRQTLVQTRTTDAYRGRVFGAFGALSGAAMLVGFGIGGALGEVVGLVPLLSAGATVRILGGLLALWLLPRDGEPTTVLAAAAPATVSTAPAARRDA